MLFKYMNSFESEFSACNQYVLNYIDVYLVIKARPLEPLIKIASHVLTCSEVMTAFTFCSCSECFF